MDPSQNFNFPRNYNFQNHPQNSNTQSQNPNTQRPENTVSAGMNSQFQMPFMMPQNFGMQYPYNHPYMSYGYPYAPPHMNYPNTEPPSELNTPQFSSGSTDMPLFSTQISLGEVGGDTPNNFVAPTQQLPKKSNYMPWSTEDNKILLTAYFHYSTDSEVGINQKSDTFWGKITEFLNEKSKNGMERTPGKCQSHFRDLNKKISSFVGCYSYATRQVSSGWSDEDYVERGMEVYLEREGQPFKFLEEWKLVRHFPKYTSGAKESESSGSKRKSGSDDVEFTSPSLVRPEGRDTTKKKARASSSKSSFRRSKTIIDEEFSNLTSARENLQKSRENTISAMLHCAAVQKEYANSQMEVARAQNRKLWLKLKNKDRDDEEEEVYQMLKKELFGR